MNKTLYVFRPLLNAPEVIAWAKEQGFKTTLQPEDMHVTTIFSKEPVDWDKIDRRYDHLTVYPSTWGGMDDKYKTSVEQFGDGAVVLRFFDYELEARHKKFRQMGASFDYDEYHPHVTLSYDGAPDDLSKVVPFSGRLEFGPERFAEIVEDWKETIEEKNNPDPSDVHINSPNWKKPKKKPKETAAKVVKVDDSIGVVFGWAMVSDVDGVPYYDTQDDHIPQSVMLKASTEFMSDVRIGKEMHDGEQKGTIIFAWPMTDDIAKAMGIETKMTGLMIGFKPSDPSILAKYKNGDYTGFSIGGAALKQREDDE